MRIGILTFHYAHNYGAVLQAYALKEYLKDLGNDVDIINYRNSTVANVYKKRLKNEIKLSTCRSLNDVIRFFQSFLKKRYAQRQWTTQCCRFESFIKQYLLNDTERVIKEDDLTLLNYDCIIAGSDQIWNKHLTGGLDSVYFLRFDTNAKKGFYAASNGMNTIPKADENYYYSSLKNVDYIATRELSLAQCITDRFSLKAKNVLDPCLLLDKEHYLKCVDNKRFTEGRFIFVYYIVEDETMLKVADFLSDVLHLPLIELHYYKKYSLRKRNQYANLGPIEFIKCMRDADFVITNSFHGTVFSVLFQKPFYSVYAEDTRKDNLLSELGLSKRHISSISEMDLNDKLDYSSVCNRLANLRQSSYAYLKYMTR